MGKAKKKKESKKRNKEWQNANLHKALVAATSAALYRNQSLHIVYCSLDPREKKDGCLFQRNEKTNLWNSKHAGYMINVSLVR